MYSLQTIFTVAVGLAIFSPCNAHPQIDGTAVASAGDKVVASVGIAVHDCGRVPCLTQTAYTTPIGGCPRFRCPMQQVCPDHVIVSSITIDCAASECCPTTPTATVTTPCVNACGKCPTSTQYTTVTTGCDFLPF